MPAPLVAVGTLLLQALPGIVSAVSDLVKSIREKRGAREIASDAAAAVSQLVDVASAAASDLPADSPLREVLALTGQLTEIMADGQATPDELRALGERLVELGAACLAAAQDGPQEVTTAAPAPAAEVLARGTAKRRQARMHARPKGQGRRPIGPAALAEGLAGRIGGTGMPVPPALVGRPTPPPPPSRWPVGRPVDDVFGAGHDKPPGGTLDGKPPRDERPPILDRPTGDDRPWHDTDDDTADVPPPVVDAPPVVEEVPPVADPAPAGVDLLGHELVCRMVHFDGLDRPGADIAGLVTAMGERAVMLALEGIPELWAMTAPQIRQFEAVAPGRLASLAFGGAVLTAREPHKGGGTALEAREALAAAGVAPCAVLGSCLDPADYVGGPWSVLVTGAEPGHVKDTDYSGFVVVAPGYVSVQSSATASAAQKSRIAREVGTGELPWGFEVMSISALAPQTGQAHVGEGGTRHYFGTPATSGRVDHPDTLSAPSEVAWSRMLDGAHEHASRIVCVGFLEAVEAASRAGVLATGLALYKVEKS